MRSISVRFGVSLTAFLVLFIGVAFGQGKEGTLPKGGDVKGEEVVVSQEFVDAAARAFAEVKLLREMVEGYKRALERADEGARARDEQIRLQAQEIGILEQKVEVLTKIKCSSIGFLWGVVKFRRCR